MDHKVNHNVAELCTGHTMGELACFREQLLHGLVPPEIQGFHDPVTLEQVDTAIALYDKDWFRRERADMLAMEAGSLVCCSLASLRRRRELVGNGVRTWWIRRYCPLDPLTALDLAIAGYDSGESRKLRSYSMSEWLLDRFTVQELEKRRDEIIAGEQVAWPDNRWEITLDDITEAIAYENGEPGKDWRELEKPECLYSRFSGGELRKMRDEIAAGNVIWYPDTRNGVSLEEVMDAIAYGKEVLPRKYRSATIDSLCRTCTLEQLLARKKELESGSEPICDTADLLVSSRLDEIDAAIDVYEDEKYKIIRREFRDCFGYDASESR